ncbi:hypothetical protein BJ912DRAFT_1059763 [Pholiota molesta]|nr:hypothetical protein BJ912DRAFT_1059763 [Pholiota molesta]
MSGLYDLYGLYQMSKIKGQLPLCFRNDGKSISNGVRRRGRRSLLLEQDTNAPPTNHENAPPRRMPSPLDDAPRCRHQFQDLGTEQARNNASVGSAARTVFHCLPPRTPVPQTNCHSSTSTTTHWPPKGTRRLSEPLPAVSFVLGGGVPSKFASIEVGVTDPLERKFNRL